MQNRSEDGTPNPLLADVEAEELPDMPVPKDIRTAFQGGLFFFALLVACYAYVSGINQPNPINSPVKLCKYIPKLELSTAKIKL